MRGRLGRTAIAKWGRALALSAFAHGFVFVAVVLQAKGSDPLSPTNATLDLPDTPPDPTFVDLASIDTFAAMESAEVPQLARPDLSALTAADEDRLPERSTAPRHALGRERKAPSQDRGAERGRPAEEPAWRHDQSTLRERVTNAARQYQPPRIDTDSHASSPQAVRREPRTGTSDSPRTQAELRPFRAVTFAQHDPEVDSQGKPSTEANTRGGAAARVNGSDPAERPSSQTAGPLAAETGARSVDVEARGAFADDLSARLASNEPRPGITDLSRPVVAGDSAGGKGAGPRPGATAAVAHGTAALLYGAPDAAMRAAEAQAATRRAHHSRYVQEIQRRIRDRLVWPKALALRLEQGETIVRFGVSSDGRLTTQVSVIKASGFQEFDDAAIEAVRRASPFPPLPAPLLPGPLVFSMRFPFENPLIR